MTIEDGKLAVIIGVAIALCAWLLALGLWLSTRRVRPWKPIDRRLQHTSVAAVRDVMAKAAALMTPIWDLVGGDAVRVHFDIMMNGRQHVLVDLEQTDDAVRVVCTPEPSRSAGVMGWLLPTWLVIEPLLMLGLGFYLWQHLDTRTPPANGAMGMQVIHCVHVAWPPFLFIFVGRQVRGAVRQHCDRYLTTLSLLLDD